MRVNNIGGERMSTEQKSQLLSLPEAAAFLGVHQATIRRWIQQGRLPASRLPSGNLRIEDSELKKLLTEAR